MTPDNDTSADQPSGDGSADQPSGDASADQPSGDGSADQPSGDGSADQPSDAQNGSDASAPKPTTSGQHEIDFETVDSPNWPQVKEGAHGVARDRLQIRYNAVVQGAQLFRDNADTLVKDAIKKPPGELSGFGSIIAAALDCVMLVVPEVGLAHEILEAAHASYELLKSASELNDKVNEQITANTVEEATNYLQELTKKYAEEVTGQALQVSKDALDAVGSALDSYIQQNPQPFQPGDDNFYRSLCDGIGIADPDPNDVEMEVWNKVFPPFKQQVLTAAARIHFFQELDNDPDRLGFLMDEAEKGNDPDALLDLIGGDRTYWDPFLAVYHSEGESAAQIALARHLGLPI
jgi:hypothetical protein